MKFPYWIKKKAPDQELLQEMERLLRSLSLHTVCEEARCPNIGECFSRKTATFMILGDVCSRNCRFCAVKKGKPLPLDIEEPKNVAEAVKRLNLDYVVVTSVTRDDLKDGGAEHFARTVKEIKNGNKRIRVEVLIPDFKGSLSSLQVVLETEPEVLNHNLETVPRLYSEVRPQADYERSLTLLKQSKKLFPSIYAKSGLMVGLGEKFEEVVEVMKDLREVECDILTIGQYLRPSPGHLRIKEFVRPEKFKEYEKIGISLGFSSIMAGPFVRSSYRAKEAFNQTSLLTSRRKNVKI
ncbi:MAG: lipoyl synthase [Candidatus Aerophobetes bacterium]|nr:lipoyl synthase [Candidatus Aerophobetes bacterium]